MIKIVTDYHSSLPADMVEEYGITLIPSYVSFGKERLTEGVDFTIKEFYQRLEASEEQPVTAPPSVEDFAELYGSLLLDSKDTTILSIHFSGKMSETMQSAAQASQRYEGRVHVFDTYTAGVAEGLMVRAAAEMVRTGAEVDDIVAYLDRMRATARIFFALSTLKYLQRGGRIGKASYLIGAVLSTKPVLTIHEGEVTGYARFNSWESALANLKDIALHVGRGRSDMQVGISHSAVEEEANQLAEEFQELLKPAVMIIGEISPVLGAHTGPGTLGVGWWLPDL